jgi:3-dehydroquinate dehydratase type I
MTSKICASVTAQTTDKIVDMILKSEKQGADLIEVRLDYLQEDPDFTRIRKLTSLPLIATNRAKHEGGQFIGNEEMRTRYLFTAASEGFEYVDIEVATPMIETLAVKLKDESTVKLILSHHDFQTTPNLDGLNHIFKEELAAGADVCKIVPTANTAEDNLTCLRFTNHASKIKDVICFCMGKQGIPSRLFSPLLGGFMTYASVEWGKEAASGQLTIEETRRFYELLA